MATEGAGLARHERDFCADAEAPLSLEDLLALLARDEDSDERSRQDAIACYLSGADGWRDAMKVLGGTFAGEATGLKELKTD
jgi:hypothetical protein